ncbi:hypothetical protein [Pseudomonas mangiferae]|uniref:Uncharacterized protein n=1 Tax=Pseudomonas mangiferae TaxID=2593654 RepID=A0A553GVD5_9PSED|nr:hypothetical protein [Pseudomonas mangiferae]TRX73416.1 hypothetical protein FM069_17585 [Pseudomonas mangiferae]
MSYRIKNIILIKGFLAVTGLLFISIIYFSIARSMDKTDGVSFRELSDEMNKIPRLKDAVFIKRHQSDRFGSALISDRFAMHSSIGVAEKYNEWLIRDGWVALSAGSIREYEYCKGKMTAALELNENTRSFSFSLSWSRYAPSRCLTKFK